MDKLNKFINKNIQNQNGGQSINLTNMSASKQNQNKNIFNSSAQKPDEKNMFSSLLDDVTYIADPQAPQDIPIRQKTEDNEQALRDHLKKASYLQTSKQESAHQSNTTNSFEVVDAVSVEPLSTSKVKETNSNLSDRIKSVVSEAPKKNSNEGASNSFDISNTSNSVDTPTKPRPNDEKLKLAQQLMVKFELEKGMVDMKYRQQMTALEKKSKPGNPLT
jgi:hypothetical protein